MLKLNTSVEDPFVITESVFSMSGQLSNLKEISDLCIQSKANCIIDEAHAFGIFGQNGMGAIELYDLTQREIPLRVIPLGKTCAAQGAIIAGRKDWIEALLQVARSLIYSTSVSPALAFGLQKTLMLIHAAEERRQKLFDLINHFQQKIKVSPLKWRFSYTPIQQLQLSCPHKALEYSSFLQKNGIFCQAIREPTVSKKDTGLTNNIKLSPSNAAN